MPFERVHALPATILAERGIPNAVKASHSFHRYANGRRFGNFFREHAAIHEHLNAADLLPAVLLRISGGTRKAESSKIGANDMRTIHLVERVRCHALLPATISMPLMTVTVLTKLGPMA